MPTFIDESGDTGPPSAGGKAYFRLAAVWLPSLDEVADFREAVGALRQNLKLRADYEFKFANTFTRPEQRRAFLTLALAHSFLFTVCSIDKTAEYWNSATGSEQQWACATSLAVHLRPIYHRAEEQSGPPLREPIVIDDNDDDKYLQIVKRAFRGLRSRVSPGSSLVGKVRFHDSGPDPLIQLADMVCGAVGAYLDGKDRVWYDLIATRDLRTFCLP